MTQPTPATDEQVAEWERLASEATGGLWVWNSVGLVSMKASSRDDELIVYPQNAIQVSDNPDDATGNEQWWAGMMGALGNHAEKHAHNNAALIAASRTAVPVMAARIRSDADRLARMEAQAALGAELIAWAANPHNITLLEDHYYYCDLCRESAANVHDRTIEHLPTCLHLRAKALKASTP